MPQPETNTDGFIEHWATLGRAIEGSLSRDMGECLKNSGRTLYGSHPDFPGKLVQRSPDGTLTPGRQIDRQFVPDLPDDPRSTSDA